jgi:uroporphyrinogen-III decarboxylase
MPDPDRLAAIHASLAIAQTMEVEREEFLEYMTFQQNRRPLFIEPFGPIIGLKEEWAAQGATPAELDFSAFRYRRAQYGSLPVNTGWLGGAEEAILEETDEAILARDARGRRVRLPKGYASLALPLDYPVRTMADWQRLKPHYLFYEERFGEGWERVARQHREARRVVTASIPGGFDELRELMGDIEACMAYYTQPDLAYDLLETMAETACRVLDRVTQAVPIDMLMVHEDFAGKSGPLVGPRQMRAFIAPYYRRVWDLVRARGARLFWIDSDGDISPILPDLLEAGINVIFPVEPVGGMDIVHLRQQYGTRLAFIGGLDKHVLRRSREEITAELERKIPPMMRTGGCVLGLDHRIPNGTPLENYRFYIRKAWEILDRETQNLPQVTP